MFVFLIGQLIKGTFSYTFCSLIFISTFSFTCLAQDEELNFEKAGDYNNFIMTEIAAAVKKNVDYISLHVHSEEYELLDEKRQDVMKQIIGAKERIGNMPALDGDTQLRDEAVETLTEYQHAFELDYKDIIGLKRKSKDSFEAMEAYWKAEDKAEAKVNKATSRLRKAQHKFAVKNNMTVIDGKGDDHLEKKMAAISAVNNYWREIYLQFFKASKEYDLMWDILPQEKADPLDNQRKQVIKIVDHVLPVLKSKPDFNGDAEFRNQTIDLLEYYLRVAKIDFAKIVEALSKEPTQEEIDVVNSIINKCNADHERLVYNWNIASQDLFKKNVEKD